MLSKLRPGQRRTVSQAGQQSNDALAALSRHYPQRLG